MDGDELDINREWHMTGARSRGSASSADSALLTSRSAFTPPLSGLSALNDDTVDAATSALSLARGLLSVRARRRCVPKIRKPATHTSSPIRPRDRQSRIEAYID